MNQIIASRYQIVREIGAGGMGRVFEALDLETGHTVAAKVMSAGVNFNLEALLRFQQEGTVLASLHHPNIVHVFGTFLEETSCSIIMERLAGRSLRQVLQTDSLSLARTRHIVLGVLAALDYAHSRAIVHRDIKPDNIMMLAGDMVKVTDFGIARIVQPTRFLSTRTGTSLGTPLYMSPEQVEGQRLDGRSDIYSLGIVIYEMVTGRPPFEGDDPITVAFKQVHKEPRPPGALNPTLPTDWEALILRALSKDPDRRFSTAAAMQSVVETLSTTPAAKPENSGRAVAVAGSSRFVHERRHAADVGNLPAPLDLGERPTAPATHMVGRGTIRRAVSRRMVLAGILAVVVSGVVASVTLWHRSSGSPSSPGQLIAAWGTKGSGPYQLYGPAGMQLDAQGTLSVADYVNNRIQQFSSSGRLLRSVSLTNLSPSDAAVDRAGTLFVADAGRNRIVTVSPAGKLLARWGSAGSGLGQFRDPERVLVAPTGTILVLDKHNNRIVTLSSQGQQLGVWGNTGTTSYHFESLESLALDNHGNVYVADGEQAWVLKISLQGTIVRTWGGNVGGTPRFARLSAIGVDRHDNLYTADAGTGRIEVFSPSGRRLAVWGTKGTGKGQFEMPVSIALDSHDHVYVLDQQLNRVQEFAPAV